MTMPVDYFAGVNAGTKNLIDAMTSIDQGRRADLQEKRLAENNVLARQTHAQQMEIGRENLDERRKAREAQAEVIAAFGKTDKVPATDYILNEDTSITPPTPAVLYSTEERAKNAMDAALKTGRPEAVGMATQAYEAFKKSNPDKATVFRDVMKEGAIIGRLQGKDAALARMKEHAIEHGLNPADVDNITIRDDGSIGGGNAQTGTWAYDPWGDKIIDHAPVRPTAETVRNPISIKSKDGKTEQLMKYNETTKDWDIPIGPAHPVQSQIININSTKPASEEAKMELAKSLAAGETTRIRDVMGLRAAGGTGALEVFNMARKINPKFNTAEIDRKIKMESDFTTGKDGQSIQSFGTFLEHSAAANEAIDAIKATNSPLVNKPINYLKKNVSGDPNFQAFMVSLEPVRKEFEGFLLGGRALYAEDRKAAETILNDASSPSQVKAALKQMGHTAKARFDEMNYRYKRTMGKDIQDPFSPEAIQSASRIGVDLVGEKAQSSTEIKLPQSAAASLKEGIETTFGNGQVWTKKNGIPTQVR
jgi:hypothetical protein